MHLQAAVDGFDVFARSLSIGAETMVMKFRPELPMHDRYAVAHDFLTPEVGDEVLTISRLINAFFRWEFNSCETLVRGTEAHPIDYANASPDVAVTSLHYYFPWAMKALLRWCVFCVVTGRQPQLDLDTRHYFEIGDREDLSYEEKLAGYRKLADEYFEVERYHDFCDSRLAHVDEMVLDWVDSADFDRLLVDTVRSTYPAHEQERFLAHFRGLSASGCASRPQRETMCPRRAGVGARRISLRLGACSPDSTACSPPTGAASTSPSTTASSTRRLPQRDRGHRGGRRARSSTPAPDAIQLSPGQAPPPPGIAGPGKPALVMRTDVANVYAPELAARAVQRGRRGRGRQRAAARRRLRRRQPAAAPGQPDLHRQCVRNVTRAARRMRPASACR